MSKYSRNSVVMEPYDETETNASIAWANTWLKIMGCVGCGKTNATRLVSSRNKVLNPSDFSVNKLEEMAPYMDAWCDTCEPRTTFRGRTKGRMNRKLEASTLASMSKNKWYTPASRYHVFEKDFIIDRDQFYAAAKMAPCSLCGRTFIHQCMDFHHVLPKGANLSVYSKSFNNIENLIEEMEKCVLLCACCHRYIEYSGEILPLPLWIFENHRERMMNILKSVNN